MRIGIIELLVSGPVSDIRGLMYSRILTRQYISIMPQVISVWCKQLGHTTHYAVYHGQPDPLKLLPDDIDFVFIATYTQCSALAYALAKLFRRNGVKTVIGGPHAKAFPTDASRYFDYVVQDCDKNLIQEVLRGDHSPGIVTTGKQIGALPLAEERDAEIRTALFSKSDKSFSIVPLIASVGCPYDCSFCVDWNVNYRPLSTEQLVADMSYVKRTFPKALVAFHDPNFAVQFDRTMDALAMLAPAERPGYIMESSLSIIKPSRMARLRETGCFAALPGVESWADFSKKAGTGAAAPDAKLGQVIEHLEELSTYVSTIQANLIFGTDADAGSMPVELTKTFINSMPSVWPAVNVPIPYGGTPMTRRLMHEGRVATRLPFSFYKNPYPVMRTAHYDYVDYYRHWIDIRKQQANLGLLSRRLRTKSSATIKAMYLARTIKMYPGIKLANALRMQFQTDLAFRRFHERNEGPLPEFYHAEYDRELGRFAELMPRSEREPVHETIGEPLSAETELAL